MSENQKEMFSAFNFPVIRVLAGYEIPNATERRSVVSFCHAADHDMQTPDAHLHFNINNEDPMRLTRRAATLGGLGLLATGALSSRAMALDGQSWLRSSEQFPRFDKCRSAGFEVFLAA